MSVQAIPRPTLYSAPSTSSSRLSDYSDSGSSSEGAASSDWSGSYYRQPSRQSSTTSLSSASSYAPCSRRPLPRVPSNASLTSKRPLPSVPYSADCIHHRHFSVRPLPSPTPYVRPDATRPLPVRTDSLYAPTGLELPSPNLSLIVDFKSAQTPMELVLESPIHPLTPITFDAEETKKQRRSQEEKLAIRLSAFGFKEVAENRDDDSDEDVVILVDDECHHGKGKSHKRCSRKWVREKKGKRWIEDDYKRVLESLRRL